MIDLFTVEFETKWMLWGLLIIPILAIFQYYRKGKDIPTLSMPSVVAATQGLDWLQKLRPILNILRLIALSAIIIAMARPRSVNTATVVNSNEGVDIMLAVDVSGSMSTTDLYPSRLEALKMVATEFVDGRKFDRIGLVIYAGEAFNKVPLTTDRNILKNNIQELRPEELNGGTAIGNGLGNSVNHLKNSKAKSKVIILMTDGVNNDGTVDPLVASEIAAHYDIRVYTIGIGSDPQGLDIPLMRKIAKNTGAKYFSATDTESLKNIYTEIDKMERTEINDIKYYSYKEYFKDFLLLAFCLLVLEILARLTIFKSFV